MTQVYAVEAKDENKEVNIYLAQDTYYFKTKGGAKQVVNSLHHYHPEWSFRIITYNLVTEEVEDVIPKAPDPPRNPINDIMLDYIQQYDIKSPREFFARLKHGQIILPQFIFMNFIRYVKDKYGEEEVEKWDKLQNFGYEWEKSL